MRFLKTSLTDVILIEPDVYRDQRGSFFEAYHSKKYSEFGISATFVQDNYSQSVRGTLRGLHAQLRRPQGKLVRVVQGEIFDVAVDARPDSSTFGKWMGERLSEENSRQMYIPPGFLHGFCVLSGSALVEYKCTVYYDSSDEIGVVWNDPTLHISWPLSGPTLSERDQAFPAFAEMKAKFEHYRFK